jgi:DNA-binding transcriptional ArsR family regulator
VSKLRSAERIEVFEAIAQPKRREILRLLADGELSAGTVASHFAVTQPAISQHLRVLKQAGLISERRAGTRRLYSVRSEGLADLHSFLADVLPAGLERLKRAAEQEERRGADARAAARN